MRKRKKKPFVKNKAGVMPAFIPWFQMVSKINPHVTVQNLR